LKKAYLLHRLDPEEASPLVSDFTELIRCSYSSPGGLEEDIFRIAVSKGITVYDASYIALAAKHNLILATKNQKLSRIASNMVKVVGLHNIT